MVLCLSIPPTPNIELYYIVLSAQQLPEKMPFLPKSLCHLPWESSTILWVAAYIALHIYICIDVKWRSMCNTGSKCKIDSCIERKLLQTWYSHDKSSFYLPEGTEGKSKSLIVTNLESEGQRTSSATVRKWLNCWETNRGLHNQHHSGRPSKITPEIAAFMKQKMQ